LIGELAASLTDLPPLKWSSLKYYFDRGDTEMGRKRHTAEEIVAKLRQVDVLMAQGRPVADAVRSIGVTEVTYYRWRNEYGGLKGDQVKRLKELETENDRQRRHGDQRIFLDDGVQQQNKISRLDRR